MEVYSADIMGTRKIRLMAGSSQKMASEGDTLQGSIEPDMIASLVGSISPAVRNLDSLISNLDRTVTSVNLILGNENRHRIENILKHLETMSADLESTASVIKEKSPEINGLDSAAASAAVMLTDAEAVTASIRDAGLDSTIESIHSLVLKLQDPSGSVGRLMTSDSLYNSLTRLSNDLDSLVQGIKQDPKKYIKISVF